MKHMNVKHKHVKINEDIEYTDGRIPAGEYECLYEEGELHFIKYGDYVVGLHSSFLNTTKKNKVIVDVSDNRERI